jgi:hypothetical protein
MFVAVGGVQIKLVDGPLLEFIQTFHTGMSAEISNVQNDFSRREPEQKHDGTC